jgi:hypothetical protein
MSSRAAQSVIPPISGRPWSDITHAVRVVNQVVDPSSAAERMVYSRAFREMLEMF